MRRWVRRSPEFVTFAHWFASKNVRLPDMAWEMERVAAMVECVISREPYPRVDFFSRIILKAMGLPTSTFTAVFAAARMTGWAASGRK